MKRIKGASLIETMISIFLVVLMIVFVFEGFSSVSRGLHNSENHVNAASIGSSLLNEAYAAGFDNVVGSTGRKIITGARNGRAFSRQFDYVVNVQNVDENKKFVWANISWKEGPKTKQVVVETLMAKR